MSWNVKTFDTKADANLIVKPDIDVRAKLEDRK